MLITDLLHRLQLRKVPGEIGFSALSQEKSKNVGEGYAGIEIETVEWVLIISFPLHGSVAIAH